jgi:hypothetical protein
LILIVLMTSVISVLRSLRILSTLCVAALVAQSSCLSLWPWVMVATLLLASVVILE